MARVPNDIYVPSFLQTIAISDSKRQSPVGYFSLPTEIRDMIMELVFVQGQVSFDSTKAVKRERKLSRLQKALNRVMKTVSRRRYEDSRFTRVLQPHGFQFLATCRQACTEGHAVFYSLNVFILPPGPLQYTRRDLKTLQPQHHAMIKKVGLTMGLLDLTPVGFEEVYHEMQVRHGPTITDGPSARQGMLWSRVVTKRLWSIWTAKLNFVLTHSEGLKLLKIVTAEKTGEFDANAMAQITEFFIGKNRDIFWSPEMGDLVWRARRLAEEEVQDTVKTDGWKALEAKVKKSAFEMSK